jgi:hypothetical protein
MPSAFLAFLCASSVLSGSWFLDRSSPMNQANFPYAARPCQESGGLVSVYIPIRSMRSSARRCVGAGVVSTSKGGVSGAAFGTRQVLHTSVKRSANQRLEATYQRPLDEPTTAGLGICCRGALRRRDRDARGPGGSIRVSERQFAPCLAHVPFNVVRKHTQQNRSAYGRW